MKNELTCKHCKRHLGWSYGTIIAEIKCSNSACRATNQFKFIQADNVADIRYKFLKPEQPPKQKDVTPEVS